MWSEIIYISELILEPYKLSTKTVVDPKLDPPYNVPDDEQDFMQQ
jgi:hypothetical protein